MIPAGELVIAGKPYGFSLYTDERRKRCDFCFRNLETKVSCHKCNYVYYCSRQCQSDGKRMHSHECSTLACRPLSTLTRLVARIIINLQEDPNTSDVVNGTKRRFSNLMDHYDDVIHDADAMFAFNRIFAEIEAIFQREFDVVEVIKIYGRVLVNSFAIQDELMRPIGRAVYLGASIFDHSCDPNASFTFVGTTVYIKAMKDIKTTDLRRIKISYIDELDSTEERIRQLRLHYYFTCDCGRCNKPDFTRFDMDEYANLRHICDIIDDLFLDCVTVFEKRKSMMGYKLKNCDISVLPQLVDTDDVFKQRLAIGLLERIEKERKSVLGMRSVMSIRIADVISAVEGNTPMALQVIDYFRAYYGSRHPRLALKLYLTAMLITHNNSLRQKLLLEARNIALINVPNVTQLLRNSVDNAAISSVMSRDRGRDRSRASGRPLFDNVSSKTSPAPTLLTLIDAELTATQAQIKVKATLSNNSCRFRSQSSTRDYYNYREPSVNRRHLLRMT